MKIATRRMTASSASRTPGSRCKLRIFVTRSRALETHRGLPELDDALLVVGRPLAVVVHELHVRELRRAGRRCDIGARRAAVAELHVEIAGLLGDGPVHQRLRRGEALGALHVADRADLETGVARNAEVDRVALRLLRE